MHTLLPQTLAGKADVGRGRSSLRGLRVEHLGGIYNRGGAVDTTDLKSSKARPPLEGLG